MDVHADGQRGSSKDLLQCMRRHGERCVAKRAEQLPRLGAAAAAAAADDDDDDDDDGDDDNDDDDDNNNNNNHDNAAADR